MALLCKTTSTRETDQVANIREASSLLKTRRDPRILKLPPYLAALCIFVGVAWLLLLPLDDNSRQTYISENALLPGQVHTYFGGSEQNIFRAYKQEVQELVGQDYTRVSEKLQSILKSSGLKTATQDYQYLTSGELKTGQNVYSVLRAPRGDGTEAVVLVAAMENADGQSNVNGVALTLTLARYFKKWSLWSKDIVFLITPDSRTGSQAWVDAYHDMQPLSVEPLPLKSGALQGAVVVDYPFDHRFESLHIVYDGINGQLPNLDLINTAVSIASGQMGIPTNLQRMWHHDDSYKMRLETMLRGMLRQGLGHASGPHSSFIPYHIDAITLQTVGEGWQDEMALGRVVESIFRSLNNLLEHFHQSFFFYLLMQANRFVSIGTYLPSAMLIAGNFTIVAIALWVKSGWAAALLTAEAEGPSRRKNNITKENAINEKDISEMDDTSQVAAATLGTQPEGPIVEREMALPLTFVLCVSSLGVMPLYIFNSLPKPYLSQSFAFFTVCQLPLGHLLALALARYSPPSPQQYILIKFLSMLLLGLTLSTLATLNFSLSLLVGLICSPFSFVSRWPEGKQQSLLLISTAALCLLSPAAVLWAICLVCGYGVEDLLAGAAFGWMVNGMWTQVVVWCIWWPAWLIAQFTLASSLTHLDRKSVQQTGSK